MKEIKPGFNSFPFSKLRGSDFVIHISMYLNETILVVSGLFVYGR